MISFKHEDKALSDLSEDEPRQGDFTDTAALERLLQALRGEIACPKKVDLSTAKFATKDHFAQVLSAMESNPSVVELDLSNYLCVDYLPAPGQGDDRPLYNMLKTNTTLRKLDLSGHRMSSSALQDLAQGLQENSTLRELRLQSCSLDEAAGRLLLKSALVMDTLQSIDLGANSSFSPEFLNEDVSSYLDTSKRIRSLAFSHACSMFAVCDPKNDLAPFWKALERNTTLKTLSLRYCRIPQDAGESLLRALTVNQSLTTLDLEFSGFGLRDKGNEIVIELLPQLATLQTLKFFTRFPTTLTSPLLSALKQNRALQYFRPCVDGKLQRGQIQKVLVRNRLLFHARTLLPHANACGKGIVPTSPSVLPAAMEKFSKASASAATFEVLKHWIVECCVR